jgi:hypothetical protein
MIKTLNAVKTYTSFAQESIEKNIFRTIGFLPLFMYNKRAAVVPISFLSSFLG